MVMVVLVVVVTIIHVAAVMEVLHNGHLNQRVINNTAAAMDLWHGLDHHYHSSTIIGRAAHQGTVAISAAASTRRRGHDGVGEEEGDTLFGPVGEDGVQGVVAARGSHVAT